MSDPRADRLYEAAQRLLEVTSLAVDTTPGGHIDYQAIWPGMPAFDCAPAIMVNLPGLAIPDTYPLQPPLQPSQRIVTTGFLDMMTFQITVLRCVPTIEGEGQNVLLPSAASISAAARLCMADLWATWNGLNWAHKNGDLFQTDSQRREFRMDPATAVRTNGGVGGFMLQVVAQIPGYNPELVIPAEVTP